MTANLLQTGWTDLDSAELRFILLELIGRPGQYHDRDSNPNTFYLPLADPSCPIKLTFGDRKQIVGIEPGPARATACGVGRRARHERPLCIF